MKRFERDSDGITLRLSAQDYARLMVALGFVAGTAADQNRRDMMYHVVQVANMINEGNDQYTPYEIPEEFRWSKQTVARPASSESP